MRHSRFSGAGYSFADDRCSGGRLVENDVMTCSHCQRVIFRADWQREGGLCPGCDGAVCIECATKMQTRGCEVFTRQIDDAINGEYHRQQNARILGI